MKRISIAITALLLSAFGQAQVATMMLADAKVMQAKDNYFRVVVKGFTCNRETSDDMLERDGKRDEVYISSISYMLSAQGQTIPRTLLKRRSRTMGDINNRAKEERRSMAGAAFGNLGGIQTGDQVPGVEPWRNSLPAKGDLLPYILWEGQLPAGGDQVVIYPTLFEYDGPDDVLTSIWERSKIASIAKTATFLPVNIFRVVTGLGLNASYNDDDPGIHPAPTVAQNYPNQFFQLNLQGQNLSLQEYSSFRADPSRPGDRPVGLTYQDGKSFYNPLQLRLDNNGINQLSQADFGYGRGIVPIRFKDQDEWKGDYTLYVSFEQVKDAAQMNQVNVNTTDAFDPLAGYTFRNVYAADKVADIMNGGKTDGTYIVLYQPKGFNSQQWRIRKANDQYFYITSVYSNMNVGLLNNAGGNGANIVTYTPNTSEAQQWGFIRYCDGSYLMRNRMSGKVMEVYNAAVADFSPLGQMDNTAAANQRWLIEK
jgi:Ricin-type beta-trefoil lectin domain-like